MAPCKLVKSHIDIGEEDERSIESNTTVSLYHKDSDNLLDRYDFSVSQIDHEWSRKILELVGNKAKLMESFSWLSTVGGGFSALGERDPRFSLRAGALSLGQQLHLAELLGDERLKVMCHLFAALASVQQSNKKFCFNYIRRVIVPLMNAMPYHDPTLTNILKHILFRLSRIESFRNFYNAIESNKSVN